MAEDLYRKGIIAAEAGDLEKARLLLAEVLRQDPQSEKAWLALGRFVAETEKKEYCFKKVLSLNPENETARDLLKELQEPEEAQKLSFTEEELSGDWENEEDASDDWGSKEELPSSWVRASEEVQQPFDVDEELSGDWSEEELPGSWERASREVRQSFDTDEELPEDWGKEKSPRAWEPRDSLITKKFRAEIKDAKAPPAKRSCLSKIVAALLSLVLVVLLAAVAALLLIDPANPPDFIEPVLRAFIPAPTATATAEIKTKEIISTQQLPPTWTPIPSPLPMLTPTPTSTPSATAIQVEGSIIITTDELGWSRYAYPGDGFAISVPPAWIYFDLNANDFEEMLAEIGENNPSLAEVFSPDSLKDMAANGVKFLAVDSEATASGAAANLNIIAADLELEIDFEAYIKGNIQELKELFGEDLQVAEDRLALGGKEAAELIYEVTMNGSDGIPQEVTYAQYLLLDGGRQYILTFTIPSNVFEAEYLQISEIAQGFELLR